MTKRTSTQGFIALISVIVISSEAEELPELCDRVLVMVEGRIAHTLTGAAITRNAIVQASYADFDVYPQAALRRSSVAAAQVTGRAPRPGHTQRPASTRTSET